jgi:hypothetical protein
MRSGFNRCGHAGVQHLFAAGSLERFQINARHLESCRHCLRRVDVARFLKRQARKMAQIGIAGCVNKTLCFNAKETALRPDDDTAQCAIVRRLDIYQSRVQEYTHTDLFQQFVPHQLQAFGIVSDTGSRAVSVGSQEHRANSIEFVHHAIGQATDDFARLVARCEKAVERIENLR